MKKFNLMMLTLVLGTAAFAQKYVPKITGSSVINYNFIQDGNAAPLTLTINSLGNATSPTKMDWSIDGYGSGSYEMSGKALATGKGMSEKAPEPDVLTKLPDYQTIACISQAAFNDMMTTKEFKYDDLKFSVTATDTASIKLNNKPLDVIHAVATNGKGEMWILNNPSFPLICRTVNSAQGIDFNLVAIK